jgi:hypothetical protein
VIGDSHSRAPGLILETTVGIDRLNRVHVATDTGIVTITWEAREQLLAELRALDTLKPIADDFLNAGIWSFHSGGEAKTAPRKPQVELLPPLLQGPVRAGPFVVLAWHRRRVAPDRRD